MSKLKPMLAAQAPEKIKFPVYASPKLDGVRCLIVNGMPLSRKLKPIRNQFVREVLAYKDLTGLDGELIVDSWTASDVYRVTSSGVMSEEGYPDFVFWVFDCFNRPSAPFKDRYNEAARLVLEAADDRIRILDHQEISSQEKLTKYEKEKLKQGFEGVMVRAATGPYKFGRSTAKEGFLLKLKRFTDAEAVIIGFEEQMHNANEAKKDELGHTKRSSHKANLVPMGTLGAFHVKDPKTGKKFYIGTGDGLTQELRKKFWRERKKLLGKTVKYKYQEIGVKDVPRFPVWLGFRDKADM